MNERIKKLYPEAIKAHNERPYHFGKQDSALSLKAYNPICGDKFQLFIAKKGDSLGDIYFNGFGCAVSKASTSILTKTLEGKKFDEALMLCEKFLTYLREASTKDDTTLNEEFKAFSAIHEFPERFECASLAWIEMQKFLESKVKN